MKLVRIIGLCALSLFAFGAISATASAELPEFVVKHAFPQFFHSLNETGSVPVLEGVGGAKIECPGGLHNQGVILNAHLVDIHLLFLGCTTTILGSKLVCGNTANSGEILINVTGHLGYTHKNPATEGKEVGMLINSSSGGPINFEFECVAGVIKTKILVTGEVIGVFPAAQVNAERKEFNLEFNQTAGKQAVKSILLTLPTEVAQFMENVHLMSKIGGATAEEAGQKVNDRILLLPTGDEGKISA